MRVGPYQLVKEIAAGGMGVVYEATGPGGERVAVKMLKPGARLKTDIVARFQREIQVLSYLDSAHVVRFFDAGVLPSGEIWVALEYLAGQTLRQVAQEAGGPLPVDCVLRWGRQICAGVGEAHKLEVVHRDLKPANIAIVDGIAKVFDFGIAKYRNWGVPATQRGMALGTLAYMAPEQLSGDSSGVGAPCDVYALGVVLFELLAGRHPLFPPGEPRPELPHLVLRVLTQDPPALTSLVSGFRPDVSRVVARALAKQPQERWAGMDELSGALASVQRAIADARRRAGEEPPREHTTNRIVSVGSLHTDSLRLGLPGVTAPLPVPSPILPALPPLPRLPDRLFQVVGPSPLTEYPLDRARLSIGRDEDNDIDVNHASVSRFHASLSHAGDHRWTVADSGSTNGVHVNGVACTSAVIGPGDALEVGDVRFRLVPGGVRLRPVPQARRFGRRVAVGAAVIGLAVGFATCVAVERRAPAARHAPQSDVGVTAPSAAAPPPSSASSAAAPAASSAPPDPTSVPPKRTQAPSRRRSAASDDWI